MADASKRIDLAAPLLSVRRHGAASGGALYGRRNEDATLAGVPFGWEHWPGRPKSVGTITRHAPPLLPETEEAARSSDALSRADSCYTVNCSVAGLSDATSATVSPGASGGGSVMMDRFLLAAKEQCAFRKAKTGAANTHTREGDILPIHLPVERPPANHAQATYLQDTAQDDGGEDTHSTAGFASGRKCGLLPTRCARILNLNPAHAISSRRRHTARRFLSDLSRSCRRETTPLLPRRRRPEHDAGMRAWEEAHMSSLVRLVRSDRACSLRQVTTMAAELDRAVPGLYTGQAGGSVHPKATHLGLLLILDKIDDGSAASPRLSPLKRGRPPRGVRTSSRRDANGHVFPPLLEENEPAAQPAVLLALPSPKVPTESWLSRTLPSVSNNPPATSFLGIHAQQLRKQQAPSPMCSRDQAKVVHHGARRRRVGTDT
uniref:Uncharacterized protein n=1 Tax=Avena sativa TaxID=4498 RepID=A0ACD5TF20_AVESA